MYAMWFLLLIGAMHLYSGTCFTTMPVLLFDMPIKGGRKNSNSNQSNNNKGGCYPPYLSFLTSDGVTFPAEVTMPKYSTKVSSRVTVRYLEEGDLPQVVQMCVDEYGSNNTGTKTDENFIERGLTAYENFGFSSLLWFGLWQRIVRRKEGDNRGKPSVMPDHNVLVVESQTSGEILGMAEVSIQPQLATRTAPPFVLPDFVKAIISDKQQPYVSNVLVRPNCRNLGLGKVLMAACEGRAKSMGSDYQSVTLHVDANISTGSAAQRLYTRLGYETVKNEGKEMEWMSEGNGATRLGNEIYFVDGLPLLYMSKSLT